MTRRIETFRCAACGRSGVRRSPDQRFCTDRCREYAEAQKPLSAEAGHPDSSPPPKTRQRPFKSVSQKRGLKFTKEINGGLGSRRSISSAATAGPAPARSTARRCARSYAPR